MCLTVKVFKLCVSDTVKVFKLCASDSVKMFKLCVSDIVKVFQLCVSDGVKVLKLCVSDSVKVFKLCVCNCMSSGLIWGNDINVDLYQDFIWMPKCSQLGGNVSHGGKFEENSGGTGTLEGRSA